VANAFTSNVFCISCVSWMGLVLQSKFV
jgi:hypothetical protein